ncbi:hypothetical protein OG613_25690 [Streptomyces sp. NBC_00015]|uniref:hypothetical protein n=1 Tax=unclassified Streptomyces TaxID=2593676 RepID=UPI00224D1261|nr:hypothetical protein [Streptomyces sp. NBC_00103]MCX5368893.1 hypothetical protein [Streptomyces sp. NBC_00103]
MPRGRHRHSPPLHRLLPPSAIAGVSLVCALGPWVFTEPMALRGLAAAAAATAILGAYVMRRWDIQAGKQVADLARARAGDEWRFEERVAELESDLDESRELRVKLEQRLRSKRTELAGLRNEHAALLRRYATAETERASALEGRRLLEIEAAPTPAPALPAARAAQDAEPAGAVVAREAEDADDTKDAGDTEGTDAVEASAGAEESAEEAAFDDSADSADSAESGDATPEPVAETGEAGESAETGEEPTDSAVFSPEGSKLFLRAQAALARFDTDGVEATKIEDHAEEEPARATSADVGATAVGGDAEAAQEDEAQGKPEAVDEHARAAAPHTVAEAETVSDDRSADDESAEDQAPGGQTSGDQTSGDRAPAPAAADADDAEENAPEPVASEAAVVGERLSYAETVRPAPPVHSAPTGAPTGASAPSATGAGALVPRPAGAVQRRPSGHFAVPTAVAVVPAAQPVRRPTAEGGFDFFGTKSASAPYALEAVQNEDLADVVGQEALALHKAESEAEFKPLDEAARGVGQVIDLTAHDETEHIDLQGLRSAVS